MIGELSILNEWIPNKWNPEPYSSGKCGPSRGKRRSYWAVLSCPTAARWA